MPLTAIAIKNAKPKEKQYKLADAAALYLLVKPNGRKLWRMNYVHLTKHKTVAFGIWPEVSLAQAREKRDQARTLIADGLDPAEEARLERLRAIKETKNTFRSVAEEWYVKNEKEGRAPVTLRKIRWLLDKAYPSLAHRPIAKIGAQEVLAVLRKVEAKGHYESARRMRSVLSRVFRYGIATARADRDVAADLRGALITPQVKHLAAITTAKEAGVLLRAIEGYSGHATTKFALRLSPHLFVRPGELRQAEWTELDFDTCVWTIPAEKMKMGHSHKVPLSRQVIALIERLQALTGGGRYLFPSLQTKNRPMSENTINIALRRLGFGQEEMTAHGFRAMAATLLNEMGTPDARAAVSSDKSLLSAPRSLNEAVNWRFSNLRTRSQPAIRDRVSLGRHGVSITEPSIFVAALRISAKSVLVCDTQ